MIMQALLKYIPVHEKCINSTRLSAYFETVVVASLTYTSMLYTVHVCNNIINIHRK